MLYLIKQTALNVILATLDKFKLNGIVVSCFQCHSLNSFASAFNKKKNSVSYLLKIFSAPFLEKLFSI